MMTRTVLKRPIPFVRCCAPYCRICSRRPLYCLQFCWYRELTHVGEGADDRSRKPPAISDRELQRRFEQMIQPVEPPPLDVEPPLKDYRGRRWAGPVYSAEILAASGLGATADHEGLV